jgi:murein DD-endopeptidase MepM/ murein hydrolase activator NlpD
VKIGKTHKRIEYYFVMTSLVTLFLAILLVAQYQPLTSSGDNYFHIYLNGELVGNVADPAKGDELLIRARREVAQGSAELVLLDANLSVDGEEVLLGDLDPDDSIVTRMVSVLQHSIRQTLSPSYTVKINEYVVNLASEEEALSLLEAALDKYDSTEEFTLQLVQSPGRRFNVLTTEVYKEGTEADAEVEPQVTLPAYGVSKALEELAVVEDVAEEKDFSEYELGAMSMNFVEEVEVAEGYLPQSQLTPLSEAIDDVTKEEETPSEYEIQSGDTLGEISLKLDIPMETLVELNSDKLETVNSTIHVGDKLVYMIPEPEISVERVERNYYEEIYDADIIYIDNNTWYTTQTKVLQQPSAGFRKVVADEVYVNDILKERVLLKEEVVMEAVPKIVERGTIVPPTYIKPISGGRLTSNFGYRKRPTKGASTYHKGVDWAVSTGTPVYASCGGTVAKAGWGSGYGNVIYINHPDGRQTRYGHLSKILVTVGQKVKQGDLIAKSGNTGVSTGPHLHFEILINGTQVNPLNYLN